MSILPISVHLKQKPAVRGRNAEEMCRNKDEHHFLLSYFLPSSDAWPVGFSKTRKSTPFPVVVVSPVHWKNGLKQWLQY